jgi:riboflavin biosynthesis pyrimidine reductase
MDAPLSRLYPAPVETWPLHGLYLAHRLRERTPADRPLVYANYIASLDGRISLESPASGRRHPPPTNPHDWRLYLELAARADAVLTSGRRLRALALAGRESIRCVMETAEGDLAAWRRARGLSVHPLCLVLSATLDAHALSAPPGGELALLVGCEANRAEVRRTAQAGIEIRRTARPRVKGADIATFARERGLRTLYVIGGPEVLYTLLAADLLDRLYLTTAHVILGGTSFDTLLHGDVLSPPSHFRLRELYLGAADGQVTEQLFATYERDMADVTDGARPD